MKQNSVRSDTSIFVVAMAMLLLGTQYEARAETIIDDFSTPHPAFGNVFLGDGIYDIPIGGAGIATSRDGAGFGAGMNTLPGSVSGGVLQINNLDGPAHFLNVQYDSATDNFAALVPTMPGGPYDFTGITEFRIDASSVSGSIGWYVGVAYGGFITSSYFPLSNGLNVIPANAGGLALVNYTNVTGLQLGIANFSSSPASVVLDDFRIDLMLVPEPSSLLLALLAAGGLVWRRRDRRRS